MKKHFISIIAVVVALAVTVCILGVGSVSAMKGRKPSAPVIGFTGGYEVTYPEGHGVTYPTTDPICVDYTSYFIIPANSNMAELLNDRSDEIYNGNPDHSITFAAVPASDKVYEFYVEERFFNQTYGTYGTAMGNNFAFKVTEECDVTIFEATHHSFVIVGDGVVIMASNNPIGQTEFGTEPQYTTVAPLTYPEGSSYYEITYPEGDYISTTGNAPVYQMGDVNRDGRVDVVDATLVQRYAAGLEELDPEQLKLAEVCGLKPVTVVNATQIQKYAAGFNVTL